MTTTHRAVALAMLCITLCHSAIYAQLACDEPDRYRETIFSEEDIEVFPIVYAQLSSSQLWNQGDTTATPVCFDPRNYLIPRADGDWDMAMNIYRPKAEVDQCTDRTAVLYVHGGGYSYAATGMEGINTLRYAYDMARRGYVVATIQYRKGWDIKAALNAFALGPLLPGCQNCPCQDGDQNCTAFSFQEMNYHMLQDTRAAHRKLSNMADSLGISGSAIFYSGSSTGSCGAMHAAYASDDMPQLLSPEGVSMESLHGGPDAIGEPLDEGVDMHLAGICVITGAIGELEWVENEDNVPLGMVHGNLDEAVNYCLGNILDMVYLQLGNPGQWLSLHGPGRIYKHVRCQSEGVTTLTHARITTLQGLYHSFTAPLGSTDATDNCDEFDTIHELITPVAEFCADVREQGGVDDQHTFIAQAHVDGPCSIGDSASYTPCVNFMPCDLSTDIDELSVSGLTVYPNPVGRGDYVFISGLEDLPQQPIELIDRQGRVLMLTAEHGVLGLPRSLASGSYGLRIGKGALLMQLLVLD